MNLIRKLVTILIILAAIVISVFFTIQNTALVPLDLLVHTFEAKTLAFWILVSFAIGGITGMLTSTSIVLRLRTALRMANRRVTKANSELDKMRVADLTVGE